MSQWSLVKLNGKSQVIPKVCPNCLQPSAQEFRYGYKGLKGWLTRTTYYQSFNYCEPCLKQARSAMGLGTWAFFLVMLGLVSAIISSIALDEAFRDPGAAQSTAGGLVLLGPVGSAAIFVGLYFLVRKVKRGRYPLRPEQALWGPAVFYVGSGFMDLQNRSAYKAVRREWIAALIQANPEQADEGTYQAFVGMPKPPAAPVNRPFGGA